MNESIKTVLSEMLSVSRRLASCAADENWDNVALLQQDHRNLLANFFSDLDRESLTAETLTALADVRKNMDMVLKLATDKRTRLASAADKIKTGKAAVNAYAACP